MNIKNTADKENPTNFQVKYLGPFTLQNTCMSGYNISNNNICVPILKDKRLKYSKDIK